MSGRPVKVTNGFQFGLFGGLGVLLALLIGSMFISLATVLTYILSAVFISLGLDPIVSWIEHRGLRRPYAVTIVALTLIGVFVGISVTVVPGLITQTALLVQNAPTLLDGFAKIPAVSSIDQRMGGVISQALTNAGAFVADSGNWPTMLGGVVSVGISIVNAITGTTVILILSLYFMASMKSFKKFIYKLVPASRREKFEDIAEQVSHSVGRYVIGQLSIAAINATLGFTFMLIMGIPYPGVLATIEFLLALVPMVGSMSGAAVVTLVALSVSPTTATVSAIYYLVYMQIEAYIISPKIMNRAVAVPGAVVVVAALAGGTLLGVLGALVAIPVAASAILIIRQIVIPKMDAS